MVKAAVMVEPFQKIEVQEFPEPLLEEGSAVLQTLYSEVCGTDVHLHEGKLDQVPYPIIPGHFSVGTLAEVRGTFTDVEGEKLRAGDTVVFLDVHRTCNDCWFCLVAKTTTKCPQRKVYGITYSAKEGLLGGWSERIYLKPGVKGMKLPKEIPPERFIGGGCGLPTAVHAVELAGIKLGDTTLIQGSGPVGLSAMILASLSGTTQMIVVGAPEHRLALARELGADHTIDIEQVGPEERRKIVLDLTKGRGADVSIEATGNPRAIPEGMMLTREGGRYVVVGQYTDSGDTEFNPHHALNRRHLTVQGCWGIDFGHFYRALRVMAKHGDRFRWERLISQEYGLDECNEALEDVRTQRVVKAAIRPGKNRG